MRMKPRLRRIGKQFATWTTLVVCLLIPRVVTAQAGEASERELLPKVWVPDPQGATREASGCDDWYDPSKNPAFPIAISKVFKTSAAWKMLDGQTYARDLALRVLDDDKAYLIDEREFCKRVAHIMRSGVSVMVNKKHAKPEFTYLNDVGETLTNAISIHIRIDNCDQIIGMKSVSVVSKRYLNVDGRFFYIGVMSRIGEQLSNAIRNKDLINKRKQEIVNSANICAMQNEALLKAWEQDIRRCTWTHRISEHGGDADAATKAINKELLADRAIKEEDPSSFPKNKRFEMARKLMAERGYNSTNKPNDKVLEQIIAEAGISGDGCSRHHSAVKGTKGELSDKQNSIRKIDDSGQKKKYVRVKGFGGLVAHILFESGYGWVAWFLVGIVVFFRFLLPVLMASSSSNAAVASKTANPSRAYVDLPKHDKMNPIAGAGYVVDKRGYRDMLLPYLGAYGNNLERRDVSEGNFCLKLMPGFAREANIERRSRWDVGFRFDGRSDSEWVYVEHMIIAPKHVNDKIGLGVEAAMAICGKPILHSKSGKDNADFKVVRFGLVSAISTVFMKKHRADDMVTYMGTILRKGVVCRVFILCLRRGNEHWMVEYVFPAYVTETRVEGGKLTVQEMRPPKPGENVDEKISQDEMQIAGMVLGNFRALDGLHCAFCDKVVTEEAFFPVELDNVKVFDDLPLRGKATCKLPCCDECKQQVTIPRLALDRIKETSDICSMIENGATFNEDWIRRHAKRDDSRSY